MNRAITSLKTPLFTFATLGVIAHSPALRVLAWSVPLAVGGRCTGSIFETYQRNRTERCRMRLAADKRDCGDWDDNYGV